jgi:hypothetical protein
MLPLTGTPVNNPSTVTAGSPLSTPLLVTYQRSGGIAGIHEVLTIAPDGMGSLTNYAGTTLASRQFSIVELQPIYARLTNPAFAQLKPEYLDVFPDSFTDTIIWVDASGSHTVTVTVGSTYPDILQQALDELRTLRATLP